jgi:FkbH-like protein
MGAGVRGRHRSRGLVDSSYGDPGLFHPLRCSQRQASAKISETFVRGVALRFVVLRTLMDLPLEALVRQRKRLRRQFLENPGLRDLRVAVLAGVTANEVVEFLEVLLLAEHFRPVFYQSEYNRHFEDAVLQPEKLKAFKPDIVYVHTNWMNLRRCLSTGAAPAEVQDAVASEFARYQAIWNSIHTVIGCHIVQNNFETSPIGLLGNADCVAGGGRVRLVWELNLAFSKAAAENRKLSIQDLNSLAASLGHSQWFDWDRWYSYKIPTTPEASFAIAKSMAAIIGAMFGKSRKCLVLDLDNTLWGGVIGDDGPDKIQIGKETALAEAYTAFQQYCLELRGRGILLAVCSKNNLEIARAGFAHPDSVLKLEHFSAFKANWEPKPQNIQEIATELNLGLDSFVFVDDNPAERALVQSQLPMVLTPDVGSDVALYPSILQATRCFEAVNLSKEDLERADAYAANAQRATLEAKFADYGAYLDSLRMRAEIELFQPVYLDRITQLINKTNQFNLTTRRYTYAEVEEISKSAGYIPLYGRLTDAFGDNGLISLLIGRCEGATLHLDTWLMSCRVLKRDVEFAMLDALVEHARERGVAKIAGYYFQTAKNAMVKDHYQRLGFVQESSSADGSSSVYGLRIAGYTPKNKHIAVPSKLATVSL